MFIVIGFASQMRLAIFKCFHAVTMLLAALIKGGGEGGGREILTVEVIRLSSGKVTVMVD